MGRSIRALSFISGLGALVPASWSMGRVPRRWVPVSGAGRVDWGRGALVLPAGVVGNATDEGLRSSSSPRVEHTKQFVSGSLVCPA